MIPSRANKPALVSSRRPPSIVTRTVAFFARSVGMLEPLCPRGDRTKPRPVAGSVSNASGPKVQHVHAGFHDSTPIGLDHHVLHEIAADGIALPGVRTQD